MRIWPFLITPILSGAAFAAPSLRSQAPQDAAKKSFANPCADALNDAEKKACWTEVARRADYFLNPDPCEANEHQSDEERDNCKMERARQANDRVTAYYRSIQKALRADLAKGKSAQWSDAGLLTELRDSQAAWARYRDLQCDAETTPYDGGTVTISIKAGCERQKAESRLKELQDTYGRYLKAE